MSTIEEQTIAAWKRWGTAYAMFTRCSRCGRMAECRAKQRRRFHCLECFDQRR